VENSGNKRKCRIVKNSMLNQIKIFSSQKFVKKEGRMVRGDKEVKFLPGRKDKQEKWTKGTQTGTFRLVQNKI
jgi:hypothetical protein